MKTSIFTKQIVYPNLYQWHFELSFHRVWHKLSGHQFNFAIFKPFRFPQEGCVWSKTDYKGFWISFEVHLPTFAISFNIPTRTKYLVGADFGSPDGDTTVISELKEDGTIEVKEINYQK